MKNLVFQTKKNFQVSTRPVNASKASSEVARPIQITQHEARTHFGAHPGTKFKKIHFSFSSCFLASASKQLCQEKKHAKNQNRVSLSTQRSTIPLNASKIDSAHQNEQTEPQETSENPPNRFYDFLNFSNFLQKMLKNMLKSIHILAFKKT